MKTQQPSVEGENSGKNASTVGPPIKPRKGTYAHLGRSLHRLGIANVMPTVADGKNPAVSGFWGKARRPVTDLDVQEFRRLRGDRGVCWSPHPGEFYVNDVDQHGIRFDGDREKHGAENLAAALGISVEELAQRLDGHLLVRTWAVSDGAPLADRLAGHWYFDGFEVPEGQRLVRNLAADVETIDHRYETVAPWSIRPGEKTLNGAPIEAPRYLPFVFHYDAETGSATFEPVRNPGDFLAALRASVAPEWLRERWVESARPRPTGGGDWSEAKPFAVDPDGEPDEAVKAVLDEYLADYGNYRAAGSHHDSARKVQLDLAHLAEEGHAGVWTALSVAEGRYDDYRPGDWDSLLYGVTLNVDRMKRGAETGDYGWVPALPTFPAYRPGLASGAEAAASEPEEPDEVRKQFPTLDLARITDPNRPPRRWLLEDVVPEGDHVSIVAPGGTGKSLFALALAVEAVRGSASFVGRRLNLPRDRRVLYVDMENSEDDLAERLRDLGVTPDSVEREGLADRLLVLNLPALRGLDTRHGAEQLTRILDAYEVGPGDVLVLDSTQRVTEGPENDNDTIRNLYNFTSAELKRRGITVIRTDNTGWDQSHERGASGKRDDVGYSWIMTPGKKGETETFALTNSKRRAGGSSDGIRFERQKVDGVLRFLPVFVSAYDPIRGDDEKAVRFKKAVSLVLRRSREGAEEENTSDLLSHNEVKRQVRAEGVTFKDSNAQVWLGEMVRAKFIAVEGGEEIVNERTGKVSKAAKYYRWVCDYVAPVEFEGSDDEFADEEEVADDGAAY